MFPINMAVEVPHNQGGFLICPFQQFVHSLIGFFGGTWHPVANSHKQLILLSCSSHQTLSMKVSLHILHISHLSTALKLLLTYSNTPPAPCPSDLWFSRSFLNNLYPSRASSLSAISGFVHDSVIPIMYGVSLFTYNSNSALFCTLTILLTFEYIHFKTLLTLVQCMLMPSSFPATRFRFSSYFLWFVLLIFVTVSESPYFTNRLPTNFKVFIIMKTGRATMSAPRAFRCSPSFPKYPPLQGLNSTSQ